MAKKSKLYDICLIRTAELLKYSYWNSNCDKDDNPFSALPSAVIEELIVCVAALSVVAPLLSSDLRLLLISDRVRNFKLEDVSVDARDLEWILIFLTSSCKNLISVKLKNVFCSDDTYRLNMKTYALERLLSLATKLEYVESCINFNVNALCNCVNLKKLVLNFPVEGHLFDFLEVDGQMVPHNSLRVLEVYEDVRHPISYIDVAVILRYCTELLEINCDVSRSLEYLHAEKLYTGTLTTTYKLQKCSLGSIYLDAQTATVSRDGVYIASLTCPDLIEIDVLVKDYGAIHALSDFHHITSLLIQWEAMHGGDYHEAISPLLGKPEFGHNLESLHVIHFSRVDFTSIGATCPNLKELRVDFASEGNHFSFLPTSFQKLVTLHMEKLYEGDCSDRSLVGILSNATDLEHLTICPAGMLTDSVLAEIFRSNKLTKVRELHLSQCALSIVGLESLARNLTALEYFEMSSSIIHLDEVATAIHEINPRVILSAIGDDVDM